MEQAIEWIKTHPEEAIEVGLNVASLIPLLRAVTIPAKIGIQAYRKYQHIEELTTQSQLGVDYKTIIEENTGLIKPPVNEKHQKYLTYLKELDNWPELSKYVKHVPEGYEYVRYPKGDDTIGLVFKKGNKDEIVFKKAKLDADYPSQRVDYVSYTIEGNRYVAKNGDILYENNCAIVRIDPITDKKTIISKEEMQQLGIKKAKYHPDVHIPAEEFIKKFGGKNE